MPEPLREPLEHLRRELARADTEAHPALLELEHHTRATLASPDPRAALADSGLRARLGEVVRRYEASHPELTRAAQNVIHALVANGL